MNIWGRRVQDLLAPGIALSLWRRMPWPAGRRPGCCHAIDRPNAAADSTPTACAVRVRRRKRNCLPERNCYSTVATVVFGFRYEYGLLRACAAVVVIVHVRARGNHPCVWVTVSGPAARGSVGEVTEVAEGAAIKRELDWTDQAENEVDAQLAKMRQLFAVGALGDLGHLAD